MDAAVICSAADAARLVWEGAAPETTPTILQTWASARGWKLVAPQQGGEHAIAVDATIATRVEEELHTAREMTAQHDADRAERALAHAESLLRAHPELPQAAWLLAEVERGWAARFFQLEPRDPDRAARHWKAAAALDGGRAPGVGEPNVASEPAASFSIEARGPTMAMRWDGESITAGAHEARSGLHQLVAKEGDAVVFAQWITVTAGAVVHVALPTAEPCSVADFAHRDAVRCATWIEAKRGDRAGTFLVRPCVQSSCGVELLVAPITYGPENPPIVHHGLPPWATWTLVGAGVVAAGILAGVVGYSTIPPTQQVHFKTGGLAPTN